MDILAAGIVPLVPLDQNTYMPWQLQDFVAGLHSQQQRNGELLSGHCIPFAHSAEVADSSIEVGVRGDSNAPYFSPPASGTVVPSVHQQISTFAQRHQGDRTVAASAHQLPRVRAPPAVTRIEAEGAAQRHIRSGAPRTSSSRPRNEEAAPFGHQLGSTSSSTSAVHCQN